MFHQCLSETLHVLLRRHIAQIKTQKSFLLPTRSLKPILSWASSTEVFVLTAQIVVKACATKTQNFGHMFYVNTPYLIEDVESSKLFQNLFHNLFLHVPERKVEISGLTTLKYAGSFHHALICDTNYKIRKCYK